MDAARDMTLSLPVIDLVAAGLLLLGLAWGLLRGLTRIFAALLWILLALGLGTTLAPVLLEQMPNTEVDDLGLATLNAFGVLAGVLLLLPVLARLLGSGGGKAKKAEDKPVTQRVFGAITGVAAAALVTTLIMPFALRVEALAGTADEARAPDMAVSLAESLALLYPQELGASLRGELVGLGDPAEG